MLLLPGFSYCSWAECDVDEGRSVATGNVLERANLRLEGYFRALYVPLGGSKTQMENAPYKLIKFYISMFSDKPPCCNHTTRGGRGFLIFFSLYKGIFFFISLCSSDFFLFLSLCSRGLFFMFFFFLRLLLPLPLLS